MRRPFNRETLHSFVSKLWPVGPKSCSPRETGLRCLLEKGRNRASGEAKSPRVLATARAYQARTCPPTTAVLTGFAGPKNSTKTLPPQRVQVVMAGLVGSGGCVKSTARRRHERQCRRQPYAGSGGACSGVEGLDKILLDSAALIVYTTELTTQWFEARLGGNFVPEMAMPPGS